MNETKRYDVVWPGGKMTATAKEPAKRLDTLDGKVIAELWSWTFKGDIMFRALEDELGRLYPGAKFISWREFGEIHGANEREVIAALPEKFRQLGVDAAITGVGGGASGAAADVRCSMLVEELGIPTVTIVTESFLLPGQKTASGLGMAELPFASYPGHSLLNTDEQVYEISARELVPQVIEGLTVQPAVEQAAAEPGMRDIFFSGSFEEVNDYFLRNKWSDSLPIVPPTVEKVEEFLRFTDRAPEEVLGIVQPDNREATVWNIAVNGVMSGCRPEYMPVLLTIIEAMLDPVFAQEHLGHSPGMEDLIIINGDIIKQLKFNCGQDVFRPGVQANTTIGRFWRLYLRNVARFLPFEADKSTFGDGFRNVLAENEDFVKSVGWEPLSTDWGYKAGDNTIIVTSCTEKTLGIQMGAPTAEGVLENIEKRMADNNLFIEHFFRGVRTRPVIILPPSIVKILADAGYTRAMVKQHFYEHARVRLDRLGTAALTRFYEGIDAGVWPEQIGTTKNLDREVQMVADPDAFQIVVSGDTGRDHVLICAQNGVIGLPACREIKLPGNWDELLHSLEN